MYRGICSNAYGVAIRKMAYCIYIGGLTNGYILSLGAGTDGGKNEQACLLPALYVCIIMYLCR